MSGFIPIDSLLAPLAPGRIFPIRAVVPPQAPPPSSATAACVAQPRAPLCPPPRSGIHSRCFLCSPHLGNPKHQLRGRGGTRGASQRSADAFSARLYPALPRRTQSSKHREGIKPELGAPGASRAAGTSNLGPEVASLMGNVPKERQGPPGYRGRGKGVVCEGAHLWVRAHDGGRNLRGRGE